KANKRFLITSKNMDEDTGSLFQICGWIILEALNATWSFLQNINAPIEIKNYFGDFTFKEGISTLNQRHLTVNPVFQARRACSNLQEIFQKEKLTVPIEGSLIFVGVDNYVQIQSEISNLNIVTRN